MYYQPKQDPLQGRVILITGASDGIEHGATQTYAHYSATTILPERNEKKLYQIARTIAGENGTQPQWFTLDLLTCTSKECYRFAQHIAAHFLCLGDILHNARLFGDIYPISE